MNGQYIQYEGKDYYYSVNSYNGGYRLFRVNKKTGLKNTFNFSTSSWEHNFSNADERELCSNNAKEVESAIKSISM